MGSVKRSFGERKGAAARRAWGTLALAAVLVIAALAGTNRTAAAQTAPDVQRALDVTEAVLDRARSLAACGPGDARLPCVYVEQAGALQTSARNSYASGFYRDALALTMRARDRAYSALRLVADATGGEFVRFSLERTDALIDRVAPTVRGSGVDQALRLLDVAVDLQRRAKALAEGGRPRAALSATSQARERAWRALRLADGALLGNAERARVLLDRTSDLLRDSAWLADAGPAGPLFERAFATQERARDRLAAGEPRRATELTLRARDELARALAAADRPLDRAAVERALQQSAQALATLHATIGVDAKQREALDRAEAHQRRAQEHYEAGRFAQALAELRMSEELRRRLARP